MRQNTQSRNSRNSRLRDRHAIRTVVQTSVQGRQVVVCFRYYLKLYEVSDIKTVLHYVDSCSICMGNGDEKFKPLVSSRKGNFMDTSGTYVIFKM